MITVIHGDNIDASRKKLNEVLGLASNIVRFNAKKDSVQDILIGFDAGELFSGSRTVVLEDLFSLRGQNQEKLFDLVLSWAHSEDIVIVYQDTVISKTTLAKFKQANVLGFELPKYYFQFMDALVPSNYKKALELYHSMDPADAEQLFYSMVKRVRTLIMIKSGRAEDFAELTKMGDWQRGKLSAQTRLWTLEGLAFFQTELFKLEVHMKSGGLPLSMANHLDLVLLNAVK